MASTARTAAQIVGANVKAELARKGRTQNQLAAYLGMRPPALSGRITGRVALDVDEVAAIADYLGVPAAELMTHR